VRSRLPVGRANPRRRPEPHHRA